MAECMAPVANADISGIGVRLAYYLQTLITGEFPRLYLAFNVVPYISSSHFSPVGYEE